MGWAYKSKIGLIFEFFKRRPLQIWLDIEDSFKTAARDYFDFMVIQRHRFYDSIHNLFFSLLPQRLDFKYRFASDCQLPVRH